MPVSVSVGVNFIFNRVDGVFSSSIDVTPEIGPSYQPEPLVPDLSVTVGPLITWFSSEAQQVTTGQSTAVSGTLSAGKAYSGVIIVPGDPLNPMTDPVYGVRPRTLFIGLGAGTGYLSGGGGVSFTVLETSIDLGSLLR